MGTPKVWPGGGLVTETWRKPLQRIADWVPVDALLAHIDVESNGDPTVVTSLGERGLFQVHPDEREFLRLTPEQFEALTTDTNLALRTGVLQNKLYAFQAKKVLDAVGSDWHGRDFWKLVKLFHGAFGMPGAALNAFARVNGHGPDTWDELHQFAVDEAAAGHDLVPGQKRTSAVLRGLTQSTFDNAEKTGERSELPIVSRNTASIVAPLLRVAGLLTS